MAEPRTKLDPEFKAQWLAALRSGEFKQGKHALCRITPEGDEYCCLGVAHELIHGPEAWGAPSLLLNGCHSEKRRSVHGNSGWFTPPGLGEGAKNALAGMNDSGATFDEIADYIEEHY